jgi:hypothetical protein
MIEKLGIRAWQTLLPVATKLAGRMKGVRPGIWVALAVALLIGARGIGLYQEYLRQEHLRPHNEKIAEGIGSSKYVFWYQINAPQVNHAGSRIIYLQTSKNGIGVFAHDFAGGKDTLLHEETLFEKNPVYVGLDSSHRHLSSFSPDDDLFACAFNNFLPWQPEPVGYITIYQADTGKEVAQIKTPDWDATGMAWLTSDKLVWIGLGKHLHMFQKMANGKWGDTCLSRELSNASCLATLSSNTVAWLDTNGICAMNMDSKNVVILFQPQAKQISEFSYCQQTDEFLVTLQENNGYSLWSLNLHTDTTNNLVYQTSNQTIQDAQWVNNGKGYAYLNGYSFLKRDTVILKADAVGEPVKLAQINTESFNVSSNGQQLFFVGTVGDNSWPWHGLWRYDVTGQNSTNAVLLSEPVPDYISYAYPCETTLRVESQSVVCYIYKPVNFNRHKKYPLLLTDTPFHLNTFPTDFHGIAEMTANCGAYCVDIDRRWWFDQIQEWDTNVLAVYNQLAADPSIDKSKIYLLADSAETEFLSKLVEEKPGPWKGVVFCNPIKLPNFSTMNLNQRPPKMLISAGVDEGESERFKTFQQDARAHGIAVEIQELPNTGHEIVSTTAVQERLRAIEDFIFNN